jgi:hypothetical protein
MSTFSLIYLIGCLKFYYVGWMRGTLVNKKFPSLHQKKVAKKTWLKVPVLTNLLQLCDSYQQCSFVKWVPPKLTAQASLPSFLAS